MTETFSHCFDDIAAPVFVLEPDDSGVLRYVVWNSAAEQQSGLRSDLVCGQTVHDLFPADFADAEDKHYRSAAKKRDTVAYEHEALSSNKSSLQRTTLIPKYSAEGSLQQIIGTRTDASYRAEAKHTNTSMTTAGQEAEQFVALAAHDLRTPMRNISIIAEMLREDFEDRGDGKLELLDLLEDVAAKSGDLLRDILTHTQDMRTTAKPAKFDLGALCQNIVDVLDPRGIHQVKWPNMIILGEKNAFHIVLRNLFDNAMKHGQRDHLSIDVDVRQSGIDTIKVEVQDNGSGFKNTAPVLTDAGFFRADKGYGLLSVRRLVRARGGSIRVQDRTDRDGCKVHFTLPGTITKARAKVRLPQRIARKTG